MNLLSYDEIFRVLLIGLIAAANIIIVGYYVNKWYNKQIEFLESKWNADSSD